MAELLLLRSEKMKKFTMIIEIEQKEEISISGELKK